MTQIAQGREQMTGTDSERWRDFLLFRRMITPSIITAIWVLSVLLATIGSLLIIANSPLEALVAWVAYVIMSRVFCEVLIVVFKINDGIQEIARRGRQGEYTSSGTGTREPS